MVTDVSVHSYRNGYILPGYKCIIKAFKITVVMFPWWSKFSQLVLD